MAVYKRRQVWWYRFTWRGEAIRESTKQSNRRVAEQIEAAHKTSLAKGEVGIRDRTPAATIRQFAKRDFLPFCRATFAAKPKTLGYYENGTARLLEYAAVADESLDTITNEKITGHGHEGVHRESRTSGLAKNVLARGGMGEGGAGSSSCPDDSRRSAPRSHR